MRTTQLREIDAKTLKSWLDQDKAVLIDIREADEYAREHIAGSRLVPLSGFNPGDFPKDHEKIGVFHCSSGNRTARLRLISSGVALPRSIIWTVASKPGRRPACRSS